MTPRSFLLVQSLWDTSTVCKPLTVPKDGAELLGSKRRSRWKNIKEKKKIPCILSFGQQGPPKMVAKLLKHRVIQFFCWSKLLKEKNWKKRKKQKNPCPLSSISVQRCPSREIPNYVVWINEPSACDEQQGTECTLVPRVEWWSPTDGSLRQFSRSNPNKPTDVKVWARPMNIVHVKHVPAVFPPSF